MWFFVKVAFYPRRSLFRCRVLKLSYKNVAVTFSISNEVILSQAFFGLSMKTTRMSKPYLSWRSTNKSSLLSAVLRNHPKHLDHWGLRFLGLLLSDHALPL